MRTETAVVVFLVEQKLQQCFVWLKMGSGAYLLLCVVLVVVLCVWFKWNENLLSEASCFLLVVAFSGMEINKYKIL